MNVISLDISTKPGYAIFVGGKLVRYGTLWADKTVEDFGSYPWNYILLAQHVAQRLYKEVVSPAHQLAKGDVHVVIEETSTSHNNYDQKKLEFIHYAVLQLLQGMNVWYVRDGSWKSVAECKLTKDEKKINEQIKEYKEKNNAKLAKLDLDGSGKARVVGRITVKHAYIRRLKEIFGISLDAKDEDQAAAILMGYAFQKGVRLCNGQVNKQGKKKSGSKKGS